MSSCICMRLMYQRRFSFRGMVQFGTPERARSLCNCGEPHGLPVTVTFLPCCHDYPQSLTLACILFGQIMVRSFVCIGWSMFCPSKHRKTELTCILNVFFAFLFLCVCVCVCVWVFVRWVIPARFLSAWQDQHCDDFGVYGGLRGFKEQVPGLKTVAVGDMVGEYLRVGWRRYATMYIYIYIIIEVTQGVKRSLHVTANSQPS